MSIPPIHITQTRSRRNSRRELISVASVKEWRRRGLLCAHRYNDKGDCLLEVPADDLPTKNARKRPYLQKKQLTTIATNEVHSEA